jgi:hypothetical protein
LHHPPHARRRILPPGAQLMRQDGAWTCDVCGGPIGAPFGDGCVEFAYRPTAAPAPRAPAVELGAHHTACDRAAASVAGRAPVSYLIACARVATPATWAACVRRMADYDWVTKVDVVAMTTFWFEAHGQPVPTGDDAPDPTPRRT